MTNKRFISPERFPYCMDAQIIPFPKREKEHDPLESVRTLPQESLADLLVALGKEERIRPEMVALFKPVPLLLTEYLLIPDNNKNALALFYKSNNGYFQGRGYGDAIRNLGNQYPNGVKNAANIARKYRLAHYLAAAYDKYQMQQSDEAFNRAYVEKQEDGQAFFATIKNNHLDITNIIAIASELRPDILQDYQLPAAKRTYAKVVRLKR